MTATQLDFPTSYTPEQQAAIDADRPSWVSDKYVTYNCGGVPVTRRGQQHFGVFGAYAYELLCARIEVYGQVWEYLPILVDGCLVGGFPDEGRSGVMHLMRRVDEPSRWMTVALNNGWVHTRELQKPAQEIADRLVEEIERGDNVLTRPPVGWA